MDNASLSDRLRAPDLVGAGLYPSITTPPPQGPTAGYLPRETAAALTQPAPSSPVGLLPGAPPVPYAPQPGGFPTAGPVGLLPPQMMLPQPMTPGQTLAASFAGGVSAMRGQRNPVLDQYQDAQRERLRSVQTVQAWSDTDRKRRAEQDDEYRMIGEGFLKSDNEAARSFGAQTLAGWARRRGINATPDWFVQTQKLGDKDVEAVNDLVYANVPDAEIIARYPRVTPQWLQLQRQMLANPQVAERLGYKRPDDPVTAAQKREADRVQNWVKSHPDFKEGGDLFAEANARFRKAAGRDITTSTKDDDALLAQVSQDARKALDDREERRKAAERAQARADRLADRVQMGLDKPAPVQSGGAIYDKQTKEFYPYGVVSVSDIKEHPTRYTNLNHQDKQLVDFLRSTGPQLDVASETVDTLLAKSPGANLSRALTLAGERALGANADLVVFTAANTDLALEMARALSGGGQLRVTVLNHVKNDLLLNERDTVATAKAKIAFIRTTLENRTGSILGEGVKKFDVPSKSGPLAPQARRIRVRKKGDKSGKVFDAELGPNDKIPAEYEEVK